MSIDIAKIYPNELKRERVRKEIKEQENRSIVMNDMKKKFEENLRELFEKSHKIPDYIEWSGDAYISITPYGGYEYETRLHQAWFYSHELVGYIEGAESMQPEIDKLTEQLSMAEDIIKSYQDVICVRGKEIDKLRKALERIIDYGFWAQSDAENVKGIAEQALKDKS